MYQKGWFMDAASCQWHLDLREKYPSDNEQARQDLPVIRFLITEVARLQKEVDNLQSGRVLTCVYCGKPYPPGSPTHGVLVLTERWLRLFMF